MYSNFGMAVVDISLLWCFSHPENSADPPFFTRCSANTAWPFRSAASTVIYRRFCIIRLHSAVARSAPLKRMSRASGYRGPGRDGSARVGRVGQPDPMMIIISLPLAAQLSRYKGCGFRRQRVGTGTGMPRELSSARSAALRLSLHRSLCYRRRSKIALRADAPEKLAISSEMCA